MLLIVRFAVSYRIGDYAIIGMCTDIRCTYLSYLFPPPPQPQFSICICNLSDSMKPLHSDLMMANA